MTATQNNPSPVHNPVPSSVRDPLNATSLGWLTLVIALAIMASIFWGELGMRTAWLVEDWSYYARFDNNPLFTSILTIEKNRPFLCLDDWLGYQLNSDSFAGLNLVVLLFFLGKGIILYALLLRLLPEHRMLAFIASVLFVVFPSDTGLFNARNHVPQGSVFWYLLAVYLLVDYWQNQRLLALAGMWLSLALCLGSYEEGYPMVIATPLLLVWLQRGISRRVVWNALLWYAAPAIMLSEAILALALGANSSRNEIIAHAANSEPLLAQLRSYFHYLIRPYYRSFIESWTDAMGQLQLGARSTCLGAALGLVIGVTLAVQRWLAPDLPTTRQMALRRYGVCFLVGLVLIGLGFIIFIPLPTHRAITERVFIFSSIGGALAVASAILFVGQLVGHPWLVALPVTIILVGLAAVAGLREIMLVKIYADQEQYFLAQIVQQAPKVADGSLILVIDKTHQTSGSLGLFAESEAFYGFNDAVRYLYHQPDLTAAMCDPGRLAGNPPQPTCTLGADTVTVTVFGTYSLNKVIAFEYQGEGQLALISNWPNASNAANSVSSGAYNPSTLIDGSAPPPARVYTTLTSWPYQSTVTYNEVPSHLVDLNFSPPHTYFGDWPAYPFIGYGWYGNWTGATDAAIDFWLVTDTDYQVQMHIMGSLLPESLQRLTLAVNGQPIPLSRTVSSDGTSVFTGMLPQSVVALDLRRTRFLFQTGPITTPYAIHINADLRFLGVQFDWVRVAPRTGQ
ncbi:MAG: hypothetical protein ABSA01_05340 [Anaerolineales bacterium]